MSTTLPGLPAGVEVLGPIETGFDEILMADCEQDAATCLVNATTGGRP